VLASLVHIPTAFRLLVLGSMYPEINVQIAGVAELAVADLESHRHLVLAMQVLVEAFSTVRGQLDVVRGGGAQQAGREQQLRCREEEHFRISAIRTGGAIGRG